MVQLDRSTTARTRHDAVRRAARSARHARRQARRARRHRAAADELRQADHRQLTRSAACSRSGRSAGERVGVLLPTSRAALVTFFALQATAPRAGDAQLLDRPGRGAGGLPAAADRASSSPRAASSSRPSSNRSSRRSPSQATIVYLEDVRGEIGIVAKLVGARSRHALARPRAATRARRTIRPSCCSRRGRKARRRAWC